MQVVRRERFEVRQAVCGCAKIGGAVDRVDLREHLDLAFPHEILGVDGVRDSGCPVRVSIPEGGVAEWPQFASGPTRIPENQRRAIGRCARHHEMLTWRT